MRRLTSLGLLQCVAIAGKVNEELAACIQHHMHCVAAQSSAELTHEAHCMLQQYFLLARKVCTLLASIPSPLSHAQSTRHACSLQCYPHVQYFNKNLLAKLDDPILSPQSALSLRKTYWKCP